MADIFWGSDAGRATSCCAPGRDTVGHGSVSPARGSPPDRPGGEKDPCIAMRSLSPPGPPLSLRARLGLLAARWGVAPDPHQGLRPWTPLRALALRTLLLS